MNRFRLLQFNFITWILKRDYKELMDGFLKTRVINLASNVSQKLYMDALTREGFLHCESCPQRFGLQRGASGKLYCGKHIRQAAPVAV